MEYLKVLVFLYKERMLDLVFYSLAFVSQKDDIEYFDLQVFF